MVIYGYIRLENAVIIYGLLYVIVGSKEGLCFNHQASGEIQVINRNSGNFVTVRLANLTTDIAMRWFMVVPIYPGPKLWTQQIDVNLQKWFQSVQNDKLWTQQTHFSLNPPVFKMDSH